MTKACHEQPLLGCRLNLLLRRALGEVSPGGFLHVSAGWQFFDPGGRPAGRLGRVRFTGWLAVFTRMFLNPRWTSDGVSRPGGCVPRPDRRSRTSKPDADNEPPARLTFLSRFRSQRQIAAGHPLLALHRSGASERLDGLANARAHAC
jgi:hypothetical protein